MLQNILTDCKCMPTFMKRNPKNILTCMGKNQVKYISILGYNQTKYWVSTFVKSNIITYYLQTCALKWLDFMGNEANPDLTLSKFLM